MKMEKREEQRLKYLFNKTLKLSREFLDTKLELDDLIIKKFEVHYSEVDDDMLIDTLDYGFSNNNMTYEDFTKRMLKNAKEYKEKWTNDND